MFCCITLIVQAADAPKYFTVWLKNGQRIDLLLSEKPNVQFNEGSLKFVTSGTAIEYNASDVKEFTLEAISPTGINNFSADDKDCVITQSGNTLSVSGAEPYAKFYLYTAGSMLVSTYVANGNGTLSMSLDQLGQGVYILKTASTTFKVMKR